MLLFFLFSDHVTIHRHCTLLFNILILPGTLYSFSLYTKIIFSLDEMKYKINRRLDDEAAAPRRSCILSAAAELKSQSVAFTSRSTRTAGTGSTRPRCHGDSRGEQLVRCSRRSGGEEAGGTGPDRARSTDPAAARRCTGCRCGGRSLPVCRRGPWSC